MRINNHLQQTNSGLPIGIHYVKGQLRMLRRFDTDSEKLELPTDSFCTSDFEVERRQRKAVLYAYELVTT